MVLSGWAATLFRPEPFEMPRSRRYKCIAVVACALALAAAGCASGTHGSDSNHRPKHNVLTEASLGFGAFHRFIWLPARAGRFSEPLSPAVSQGALAARFTSKELRVAARRVRGSKQLQVLFAPLELTADKISALASSLTHHSSLAQVEAINEILRRIAATAKDNGARIVDASASQIAAAGGPRA
jgi:hypothetical protein